MPLSKLVKAPDHTSDSCYWQQLTYHLNKSAQSPTQILSELKRLAPELQNALHADAENPEILKFWGLSKNYDSGIGGAIVNPVIMAALNESTGSEPSGEGVNSGLIRTYGYLLSNAVMPYGAKRSRWTDRLIDRGFGWPARVIAPVPDRGTLLSNLTLLAGRIAYYEDPAQLQALQKVSTGSAQEIGEISLDSLEMRRLVEEITLAGATNGTSSTLQLRTDVVKFPVQKQDAAATHVIVYSVKELGSGGKHVLISLAPVTQDVVDELFSPDNLGSSQKIDVKHNLFADGIPNGEVTGSRFVQAVSKDPNLPELVMNDDYWPPYAFGGREGLPRGFAKEIIERCVPTTGRQVTFIPYPIARTRAFMESGTIDFHIYSYEKSRESFLQYATEPLFVSSYQPAVRSDSGIKIETVHDFDPLRMGGLHGLVYTPEFKKYIDERHAKGRYDIADSEETNVKKLVNNRIDVFVNHKNTILWFAGSLGFRDRVKVLDYTVKRSSYFLSLSKNSQRLKGVEATRFLAAIDGCVRQLKAGPFYQALVEKYKIE